MIFNSFDRQHRLFGRPLLLIYASLILVIVNIAFSAATGSSSHGEKRDKLELLEAIVEQPKSQNASKSDSTGFGEVRRSPGLYVRQSSGDSISGQTSSSASSTDFTCGPNKPCANGACCGASGWCGYEPKYCGTGCQSNCDAKAECGTYASPSGKGCPLNVCCSQYGFCGTTDEFCGTGCQSNCAQPKPSVRPGNVQKKIVAYWEGWNSNHACGTMSASEIPVDSISHLNFAFGYITPDYRIQAMDGVPENLLSQITSLKAKNPSLLVSIALGGWTFTDPGTYRNVFTDMVSSAASRQTFITNLLGFLTQYGFDGVDFDWEYPGADDRGGKPSDGVNYTQLLKELRDAIRSSGRGFLVTFTAPTSYWYLRHFDITAMMSYVDWMNLMSYDLHGVWDSNNPIGSHVLAHTNTTEINLALDLLWRNNIDPSKIVLGMGFYGRSFKLQDPSCWTPGCLFESAGDAGPCTGTEGILSYKEIMDILASTKAQPYYDSAANVNYIVYGQNNWISFDNAKSFQAKIDFANAQGLMGLMVWAIDLDDEKRTALAALTGEDVLTLNNPLKMTSNSPSISHSTDDPSKCRITDCGGMCTNGERAVGRMRSNCGGSTTKSKWVCCPAWTSLNPSDCNWYKGNGGVSTDCAGQCGIGQLLIAQDSYGWTGDLQTGGYGEHCLRGAWAFCCNVGNMQQYLDICSWTGCGGTCPPDKQFVLTTDSGGPTGAGPRCDKSTTSSSGGGDPFDPNTISPKNRKLCCPMKDSFSNCKWLGQKVCSVDCSPYQITLDQDPQGQGGSYCNNNRQQVFCCDAPGNANTPFLPVDLNKIFPPQYLPPPAAIPQFSLNSFGGASPIGDTDPNASGVAFFLIAGSSAAVTSLNKRDNPGIVFLDCPSDVFSTSVRTIQTARVICMDDDLDKCFGVRYRGVEGTVVHMPEECGEGSWARAVSLVPSQDQTIPVELALQGPTSAVYDFSFDYNIPLIRRDAGAFSIRLDISNVPGYWNAVVNSPGSSNAKRDLKERVKRFYSSNHAEWFSKFDSLPNIAPGVKAITQNIDTLLFYEAQTCPSQGVDITEAIAIGIMGNLDVTPYYGFSLVATYDGLATVQIHESAGFFDAQGDTSASFRVAGTGTLDPTQKLGGNSITQDVYSATLDGQSLYHGWADFESYIHQSVQMTANAGGNVGAVTFDGYMEAQASASWGRGAIHFPDTPAVYDSSSNMKIGISSENVLTPLSINTPQSEITVANQITLGLTVDFMGFGTANTPIGSAKLDFSVTQTLTSLFNLIGDTQSICLEISLAVQDTCSVQNAASAGWGNDYTHVPYAQSLQSTGVDQCFNAKSGSKLRKKRQNNTPPVLTVGESPGELLHDPSFNNQRVQINCNGCGSCTAYATGNGPCCGCTWIQPDVYDEYIYTMEIELGNGIVTPYKRSLPPGFNESLNSVEDLLVLHYLEKRANNPSITWKDSKICNAEFQVQYVSYPDYYLNPNTLNNFDANAAYMAIQKYFHNSTSNCWSFSIGQFGQPDQFYAYPKTLGSRANPIPSVQGQRYHQLYETEHPFEAQTISRFFGVWLSLTGQAAVKRDCTWVETFVTEEDVQWGTNGYGSYNSFYGTLMDELGSLGHLDRLTVFLANSNGHKGTLFGGKQAIRSTIFMAASPGDEQITMAREIGFIFPYMNTDDVWQSFCASYNGMLTKIEGFDQWYQQKVGTSPNLAAEWPKFIRSELDLVVTNARANINLMNNLRSYAGVSYVLKWALLTTTSLPTIKLSRTDYCRNLPPSLQYP